MVFKPSIPKGTRDFGPMVMSRRNYIFDVIRTMFKRYGYMPIETPAMENLSTLLGKYGDEGDKLLFRILNSGDFLKGIDPGESLVADKLSGRISEKGLRYDLTVPFARYIVQNRHEITFPFKRYQIQPVWRADRPQKGRYREFYQCDADVIGSDSLLNEAELVSLVDDVFGELNINVEVKINNRKILSGIAEYIGHPDKLIPITIAIDKLDKIGLEEVTKELVDKGIPHAAIQKLQPVLFMEGNSREKLGKLSSLLDDSSIGRKGIEETNELFDYLDQMKLNLNWDLDLTLARGLNYYTGAIIEVEAVDVQIGSICGGGRYDDLTGVFGLEGISGIGISFGADRIYDVMMEKNLFPQKTYHTTQILFLNFGKKESAYCLPYLQELRMKNLSAELYPDADKIRKQLKYADNKQIPIVVMAGEKEIQQQLFSVKWMQSGDQKEIPSTGLIQVLEHYYQSINDIDIKL
ncbi:MAG: histidine--tRNA ligase [Bacteroidales bacterium]|nr:histidine--tRNA ligase [Bacteroidales bacterium]